MACTCMALYQVPRDPKALYTTISHSRTLTVVNYIVATAALGQTDRDEAPLCPLTTSSVAQGQLRQAEQGFESATHRFQDKPLPLQPSSPCIKNDCVLYALFLVVLRHGLEQLALHYR
ncbi:hypothetical protein AMECASPLE_033332 [Ameca splendens]|uniref:Uncharacterized protein n=1 Tax=Ameca splendens TaxID=208324 RepID=A0ABV0YIZ3_9TELE